MRLIERILLGFSVAGGLAVLAAVAYGGFLALDAGDDLVAFQNPSGAMEPTLLIGDDFTGRRLPRGGGAPPAAAGATTIARGEIVMHEYPPDPSKRFVKRVVGLPGDTLAMRRGTLVVNGHAVTERYAWHSDPVEPPTAAAARDSTASDDFAWQRDYLAVTAPGTDAPPTRPSRNDWGPIVVPPDSYFVLGDNRDNSLDSRYWGFVTHAQIVARARRVYFSRDPATGRIRWSRFGHVLR